MSRRKERLPADYVEQILLRLRRADIVRSTRGARGGYMLARPADEVTVREIIQASELSTFDLHCVSNPVEEGRCAESHNCSIRPVWQMLQQQDRRRARVRAPLGSADGGARGARAGRTAAPPCHPGTSWRRRRWRVRRPASPPGAEPLIGRAGARARAARAFVASAFDEPDPEDVRTLASVATRGDVDHATWELRYARRALAVVIAERRAHDDRTPSLVASAVHDAFANDPNVAAAATELAERQFNDRLAAYRDALLARTREPAAIRLARVLLVFAGALRVARGDGLAVVADVVGRVLGHIDAEFDRSLGATTVPH